MKKKILLMFTRHSSTPSAKIVVNLHIDAVVKVKLGRKAMQPLLVRSFYASVVDELVASKSSCCPAVFSLSAEVASWP